MRYRVECDVRRLLRVQVLGASDDGNNRNNGNDGADGIHGVEACVGCNDGGGYTNDACVFAGTCRRYPEPDQLTRNGDCDCIRSLVCAHRGAGLAIQAQDSRLEARHSVCL